MCLGNCFPISIRSNLSFILASLLCRAVTAGAVKQYWKALWQCAAENTLLLLLRVDSLLFVTAHCTAS